MTAPQPRQYLVRLHAGEAAADLVERGTSLLRPIPVDQTDGEVGWYLALLLPEEVVELTHAGYSLRVVGTSKMPGDPCDAEPEANTFCAYQDAVPRCARSILQQLDDIRVTHPPLAGVTYFQIVDLGTTLYGRPIRAVRIGRAWDGGDAIPQVVVVAGQHAQEWAGPEMAMRLIRHFADGYRDDPEMRGFLKDRVLTVLPVANPDGYDYTFASEGQRGWRKNLVPCPGSKGVDPNRNFAFTWGLPGAADGCWLPTYRGPHALSEVETVAIRVLAGHDGLDGQYDTAAVVDLHTYGNTVAFPEGLSTGFAPCSTNSNCTAADTGALQRLFGSDRTTPLRDETSGWPYVVDSAFRAMYAISGDLVHEAAYGALPGRTPQAAAMAAELTWACGFYAERIAAPRLDALFDRLRELTWGILDRAPAVMAGTFWEDEVGSYALPHLHRRHPLSEDPVFRIASLKSLTYHEVGSSVSLSIIPDDVLPGVAYHGWAVRVGTTDHVWPPSIQICSKPGCITTTLDGGDCKVDLCSPEMYSANGWTFVPRAGDGAFDDCFWEFTGDGAGPWRLDRKPIALTGQYDAHLAFSYAWNQVAPGPRIIVSSNHFVDCSPDNWGRCRVVASWPNLRGIELRNADYRTAVIDIGDFDGKEIEIRVEVDGSPSSMSFRFYDRVVISRVD